MPFVRITRPRPNPGMTLLCQMSAERGRTFEDYDHIPTVYVAGWISQEVDKSIIMEPVLIPDFECAPSCLLRHGADEEHAITFRANQPSSSAANLKKRKRCASSDLLGPRLSAPFVRPPSLARRVSEADVTAPHGIKKEQASRKQRRVQFGAGDAVHVFPQFASRTRGETGSKGDLWYSRSELSEMKRSARRQTRVRRSVSLDSALNKVYMSAKNQLLTPHDVVGSALELIGHPLFGELRGLERWGSDSFGVSRGTAILHAKSEVLLSQCAADASRPRFVGGRGDEDGVALAKKCESASEPAQKFAQVLGLVDYILAQEDEVTC
jgi:hypothetical protein